jgi:hypothetical protein
MRPSALSGGRHLVHACQVTDIIEDVAGSATPAATRRGPVWLMAALAAVVVVAAVAIGVVVTRGESSAGAQQFTSTERACQQWTTGYTPARGGSAPTAGWCTAMTDWMRQQLHGGHLTGPMMWSDATSMRTTCRSWMSSSSVATSGISPQACDDMVAWMGQHAGSWSGWMMTGHMMGHSP